MKTIYEVIVTSLSHTEQRFLFYDDKAADHFINNLRIDPTNLPPVKIERFLYELKNGELI